MAKRPWETDELSEEWIPSSVRTAATAPFANDLTQSAVPVKTLDFNLSDEDERFTGSVVIKEDVTELEGGLKWIDRQGHRDLFSPSKLEKLFEPPVPQKSNENTMGLGKPGKFVFGGVNISEDLLPSFTFGTNRVQEVTPLAQSQNSFSVASTSKEDSPLLRRSQNLKSYISPRDSDPDDSGENQDHHQAGAVAPRASLFHYDTPTREHLSALCEDLDNLISLSPRTKYSTLEAIREKEHQDRSWAESFLDPPPLMARSLSPVWEVDEEEEGEVSVVGRVSVGRSAKRIRLMDIKERDEEAWVEESRRRERERWERKEGRTPSSTSDRRRRRMFEEVSVFDDLEDVDDNDHFIPEKLQKGNALMDRIRANGNLYTEEEDPEFSDYENQNFDDGIRQTIDQDCEEEDDGDEEVEGHNLSLPPDLLSSSDEEDEEPDFPVLEPYRHPLLPPPISPSRPQRASTSRRIISNDTLVGSTGTLKDGSLPPSAKVQGDDMAHEKFSSTRLAERARENLRETLFENPPRVTPSTKGGSGGKRHFVSVPMSPAATNSKRKDLHMQPTPNSSIPALTVTVPSSAPPMARSNSRPSLMTIGPHEVEDLLSQSELVGKMVFDPIQRKWVKAPKDAQKLGGTLDTESGDESVTSATISEEDPFAGIESLKVSPESSKRIRREVSLRKSMNDLEEKSLRKRSTESLRRSAGASEGGLVRSRNGSMLRDDNNWEPSLEGRSNSKMNGTISFGGKDELKDSGIGTEDNDTLIFETENYDKRKVLTNRAESSNYQIQQVTTYDDNEYEDDGLDVSPLEMFDATHGSSRPPEFRLSGSVVKDQEIPESQLDRFDDQEDNLAIQLQTPAIRPVRPKSALKNVPAPATPYPAKVSDTVDSRSSSKPPRSVSFSDGKMSGKIRGLDFSPSNPGSSLKNELILEGSMEKDQSPKSTRYPSEVPSTRTKNIERALESLENAGRPTPLERTLSYDSSFAATPRIKIRAKNLRSASSNKTLTVPTNGNRTILTDCSFGISENQIIKFLTDIEPFEPNWEKLRSISLSDKHVESVVRLKEYCPLLDEVDLCQNEIEYLTGIPSSIRTLLISNNRLTSLTSFGHLTNLERLDVSFNSISSVDQLSQLRHLRELKADHNQISSLDGLDRIDGLIKLSLRSNSLSNVDLSSSLWKRMELLDLGNNKVKTFVGLEKLQKLIMLNLDDNCLCSFDVCQKLPKLRILRISNNRLSSLEVQHFPHLRTLFADDNQIEEIKSISKLRKLENLSLKDQTITKDERPFEMDLTPFRDVRRLYLAGNTLTNRSFPPTHFLSLTYLDLSRCHLNSLPKLTQSLPNLRYFSLGHNYLSSLESLAGLTRLRSLFVPQNLLVKVRHVIQGIKDMQELEVLDTRGNKVSWGLWWDGNSGQGDREKWKRSLMPAWQDRRKGWREAVSTICPGLRELDGEKIRRKGKRDQTS